MELGFNAKMLAQAIDKLKIPGLVIEIEEGFGCTGRIKYKNKYSYFYKNLLDLNKRGVSELIKDKSYTYQWLNKAGWPIPEGRVFYSNQWATRVQSTDNEEQALKYARKLRWPLIIKPNNLWGGQGVNLVNNEEEFRKALSDLKKLDTKVFLVQKKIEGLEIRLLVLDKKIILKYGKKPLSITGDGKNSIKNLLIKKKLQLDKKIIKKLNLEKIPLANEEVFIKAIANLSNNGQIIDLNGKTIHQDWNRIARQISNLFNLRYFALDIITSESPDKKPRSFVILEMNTNPSLKYYYLQNKKRVEKVYEKIVLALFK